MRSSTCCVARGPARKPLVGASARLRLARSRSDTAVVFLVFAPLAFIVLALSKWPWKSALLAALVIGLAADVALDYVVALRR